MNISMRRIKTGNARGAYRSHMNGETSEDEEILDMVRMRTFSRIYQEGQEEERLACFDG